MSEPNVVEAARGFLDGKVPPEVVVEAAMETDREQLPKPMSNVVLDLRYEQGDTPHFAYLASDLLHWHAKTREERNVDRAEGLAEEIEWAADQIESLYEEINDLQREHADKIKEWEELTGKKWR